MPLTASPVQERRRFARSDGSPPFAVNLLQPTRSVSADGLNFSTGGLCLRVQETLEVRSLVRLQLILRSLRPVTCVGRVSWVVQRLDLRGMPPFLYDIGVEFVDPPASLRQLLARQGVRKALRPARPVQAMRGMEPAVIRGREFVPKLERMAGRNAGWHLVVSVGGVPCFSHHYASERSASAGWASFKYHQARRRRP